MAHQLQYADQHADLPLQADATVSIEQIAALIAVAAGNFVKALHERDSGGIAPSTNEAGAHLLLRLWELRQATLGVLDWEWAVPLQARQTLYRRCGGEVSEVTIGFLVAEILRLVGRLGPSLTH